MNIDRGKESFTDEEVVGLREQLNEYKRYEGKSWTDLEKLIGDVAATTLSAFANGTYQGDNRNIAWKVNRFFVAEEARAEQALIMPVAPGFRFTKTARMITQQLRWAHEGEMAIVVGEPGVGKTAAFDQYCATTPNAFKATMSPATRAVGPMLAELNRAVGCRVKSQAHVSALYQTLVDRLDGLHALLVVDEAQHLSDQSLDQLRSLHDRIGLGVVLAGNRMVLTRVQGGARLSEFAQLYSRVSWPQTYDRPEREDVMVLCDAWSVGTDKEREFLVKVASLPGGIRSLTQTLKMATLAARATEEERTLSHLKSAWQQLSRQQTPA